ncbi:polysaccharide biosynthesis protein [Halobacillus sp. A1]|uniref:putative polysaccharide biosynthesis protein n=1 Tax=Halobacillus sp. A1 TaxID=2880262 RepID=UPI0020A62AC4|nr:polysaccharide biosynthesis protein [Halobacillus sp. A1]MCP3031458.1 polysaccharide biosynthesis protein [Halobacillus sp. A1]
MSKSNLIKSTFILSIAALLSKILGSVFRIPLQNIAGDQVLGIFTLVYPVYMVALILSVAGIPIAISKMIAEAKSNKNLEAVGEIKRTAHILGLLFGIASFTILYIFSEPLSVIMGDSSTETALIIVASSLLFAPYMAVYRGYFQGFDDMKPTAVSQVLEQLFRVSVIIGAALLFTANDFSEDIVAGGVMSGSVIGVIASLLYLQYTYKKSDLPKSSPKKYQLRSFILWSKRILKVSIPVAIGSITMALLNAIDSLTIPLALHSQSDGSTINLTYLYGVYGRGLALVQITTVFATSIVLPLIPLLTKKIAEKKHSETRELIEKSNYLTHLISWPAAFGLLALTLPLNLALFTNLEGSSMLAVIGFSSAFTSLALVGTGIMQGINLNKTAAFIVVTGVTLKALLNIVFINFYGILGAAISTLIIYILLVAVNTIFIRRTVSYNLFPRELPRIILAAAIMGMIAALPSLWLNFEHWSRAMNLLYVFLVIIAGALVYFLQLFLMKVINRKSLANLPFIGKRWKI